jgi:hypothetical protein
MGTSEALVGREQIVTKLTKLVRQHSMVPKDEMTEWRPSAQSPPSLDSFQ